MHIYIYIYVSYTAQSDLCEMSSDKLNIAVIVVLTVLLFISLALNIIMVVWIIYRATRRVHKVDSVTQDMAMQKNVAYAQINIH